MLQQFYADVLPHQGHYCLFFANQKRHVWFDSLDDLSAYTEARSEVPGLYFATASFHEPATRSGTNAFLRRSVCLDIDAGEAKFAKHGNTVYETQKHAIAGLIAWCKANALEPTYVVSSGAGLHVYFCVDRDISIPEWQPLALAIKGMALAQGLRIDPTVTGDTVRVLRPPGTLHSSGARVRLLARRGRIYTVDQLAALVTAFVPPAPTERKPTRSKLTAELLEPPAGPPKSVSKIRKHCPAMAHAMDRGGNVAEPYWRAMLGVIKFTVEGDKAAHEFSSGHPDYDFNATQDKFDRWNAGPTTCATFAAENPSACAGCAYNGKVKSPIQLGELTAQQAVEVAPPPAPAPAPAEEAEYVLGSDSDDDEPVTKPTKHGWDEYLPDGFKIVETPGGFLMVAPRKITRENAQGEKVTYTIQQPFCAVPFWFESWAPGTSNSDQAQAVYCVFDPGTKRTTRYTMPTRALAVRNEFMGVLASQNVQVYPSTKAAKDTMEDYVKASMERIRSAGQRPKITERFGTLFNAESELMVAQGVHLITKSGDIYEAVVGDKLRTRGSVYRVPLPPNATGHWGPEVWDEHIVPRAKRHIEYLREYYSDDNFLPYQLAIMLAWSSPLLAFMQGTYHPGSPLPNIGLTVSLYSPRSGIGKTSAMHAAALAFGVPTGVCLQLDRNSSTNNARQAMLLQSGTMPGFMDEMEDVDPRDLAALVSAVGNGVSKTRMRADLTVMGGEPMALINLMSTNKSHRELIVADRTESAAVQLRMLEIECSGVAPVSARRAMEETQARSALNDCAGAVGALIHYVMCKLGSDALNKLGIECAAKAREMLMGHQDGRLLWRAFGAMILMRRLLKYYDIKVFELDALAAEFKRWHDRGYEFAEDQILPSDPRQLLAIFLSDIAGNTLITNDETHRGAKNGVVDVPLNDRVPDNVLARSVLSGRYVYIKIDALREWCGKRRVGFQGLVQRAADMGVFERQDPSNPRKLARQIDLFKGTKYAQNVRPYVFKVFIDRLQTEADAPPIDNVIPLPLTPRAPDDTATEHAGT